jgi:hypothetical protein
MLLWVRLGASIDCARLNSDLSESTFHRWQEIARVQPDGSIAQMLAELKAAEQEAVKRYGGGNGQYPPSKTGNIVGGTNGHQPPALLSWRDL